MKTFKPITLSMIMLMLAGMVLNCSKESTTEPVDTRTGSLLLGSLSVAVLPAGIAYVNVIAKK
jgi:hypothetical protein